MLLLVIACKKEPATTRSSCVDQFLATNQLVKYTGQDIGCKFYVALFELDGAEYFYADCHCADMLSIPIDCDGNAYCSDINSPELIFFFQNAVNKGIVGFEE